MSGPDELLARIDATLSESDPVGVIWCDRDLLERLRTRIAANRSQPTTAATLSNARRYHVGGDKLMHRADDGAWVSFADYAALAARCDRAEQNAKRYEWLRACNAGQWDRLNGLRIDTGMVKLDAAIDAYLDAALASQAEGER